MCHKFTQEIGIPALVVSTENVYKKRWDRTTTVSVRKFIYMKCKHSKEHHDDNNVEGIL